MSAIGRTSDIAGDNPLVARCAMSGRSHRSIAVAQHALEPVSCGNILDSSGYPMVAKTSRVT